MSDPEAGANRCAVCRCATPAGSHYGAVTCHACKSFFKRTVQFSLSYACMRRPRHCSLNSERSRACGSCRFRRCLQVGMRPALVRSLAPEPSVSDAPSNAVGRDGQQQQQQLVPYNSSGPCVSIRLPPGGCLPLQQPLSLSAWPQQLQQLHQQYTQQQSQLLPMAPPAAPPPRRPRRILPRLPSIPEAAGPSEPQQSSASVADSSEADEDVPDLERVRIDMSGMPGVRDLKAFMSTGSLLLIESYLGALVRWAKKLLGFSALIMEDRVALMQRHWVDIIILQVAWNSQPYSDTLQFCEGFFLHESQEFQDRAMGGERPRISQHTRCLAQLLGQLNLRHAELLHLRAVIFLETGCFAHWADPHRIDILQRRHLQALIRLCPCPVRRGRLLLLSSHVAAGRLMTLAYFDRSLNLEGQMPPPLAEEMLRASLADLDSQKLRPLF